MKWARVEHVAHQDDSRWTKETTIIMEIYTKTSETILKRRKESSKRKLTSTLEQ